MLESAEECRQLTTSISVLLCGGVPLIRTLAKVASNARNLCEMIGNVCNFHALMLCGDRWLRCCCTSGEGDLVHN